MKNLIIVESPTKAKTISKFLGEDFQVESSQGHVRDLPKSKLGIDLENNFEPQYITIVKARTRVNELKKNAAKAETVILATDEDREGEAIAWHLIQALGLEIPNSKNQIPNVKRIVFHEITESAIKEALKNPREIDLNLVDAQQARRILDRLVGYKLSPFLWKKVAKGLSAGRVQSVTVKLIVEREKEIEKFKKEEYWTITALFKEKVEAQLIKINDKTLDKFDIPNQTEAEKIIKDLDGAEFKVLKIEKKESKKNPLPPFITSTLQQSAWQRFHFSAKQTMMFAQQLYEQGFITYMRTDSLNLSEESLNQAEQFIKNNYGENYSQKNFYKTKSKTAQEAHEAIRPSQVVKQPTDLENLPVGQAKLYDLIWRRFVASQMKPMILDNTAIDIGANPANGTSYIFRATGSIIKFDGFSKVYSTKREENILPELKNNQKLELEKINPQQHFTEPPPRYTEASLVKTLEKFGIGRPSTYAPTMSTIQERNYVTKDQQRRFYPTEIGLLINDLLIKHFPEIVEIKFTANMENSLDQIAAGEKKWIPIIKEFYEPFSKNLEIKYKEVEKNHIEEKSDQVCEKCGKPMVIKFGRFGKFLACSGFPECKTTKTLQTSAKTLNMKCPKCNEGDVVIRRTRKKRIFYGCSQWPKCDYASWQNPMPIDKNLSA